LARVLNTDANSPFYGHVAIGVIDDDNMVHSESWSVSFATVVDGILKLITSNPKRDRDDIAKFTILGNKTRQRLKPDLNQPLRGLYLQNNDRDIYDIICKYFHSAKEILWDNIDNRSYIVKTVGVQALFDVLKLILKLEHTPLKSNYLDELNFQTYLDNAATVDFSDPFFQASGKGRGRIKNILGISSGLLSIASLNVSNEEKSEYLKVAERYGLELA
jgi:hypothetical protein